MVKCELRIISGARAGHHDVFDKPYIGIGRHPLSDLRFDAEQDLDASARHAAIVRTGDTFVIKDLGSTNGTYVNGERLEGERQLHDGDMLRFGVHGPETSFHILREGGEVVMEAVRAPSLLSSSPLRQTANALPPTLERSRPVGAAAAPAPAPEAWSAASPAPPPATKASPAAQRPPTATSVLRAEISVQRSRYRALAVTLLVIVLGAVAVVFWLGRASNKTITAVQHRADSLAAELVALQRVQAQNDSQKAQLEALIRRERDPSRVQQLRNQLTTVTRRSAAIQQAQGVDYTAIRNNDRAVAIIYIRFPDSSQFAGTAFSVSTSGLMLTNKHVVISEHGEQARELAIQFSGSTEVLPARLVRVSPDADLAVIQLESRGPFPAVAGLGQTPAVEGAPIALIGFPGAVGGGTPRATLVMGSVTRVIPDSLYELEAFSGTGASGSPIFDRDGRVIGVEFGGIVGTGGRAIVGVPISRGQALLPK